MPTTLRREPRVPPREKALAEYPLGKWLLRRKQADAWALQSTRDTYVDMMEDYVATRSWASHWAITERFASRSINRAIPRGPSLLINPPDEDFIKANLHPILLFRVVRDRDSREFEVTISFPLVNSTPVLPVIDSVRQTLDALHRGAL